MLVFHLLITNFILRINGETFAPFNPLTLNRLVQVRISSGYLRGFETSVKSLDGSHLNKTAYVFKKIPFAEPAVGAYRFRKLRPKQSWKGVLDTIEYGPTCMTKSVFTASLSYNISEDCLFANIFAGSQCFKGKKKCPVLFYIYSGAFVFGSPRELSDFEIVQRYAIDDIIFVTFGYRVGIFGFIDSHYAFPNIGFDDVIFALKWTNREIENFGGDKNQLTIAGFSSGAFISQMLLASPDVPVELFQRAIIGSCTGIFGPHANREHTKAILADFNCLGNGKDNFDEVECLRKIDGQELLNAQGSHETDLWQAQHRMRSSAQIPGYNIKQVLSNNLEPRTILTTTTLYELTVSSLEGLCNECSAFGYYSRLVYNECLNRYVPIHLRLIEEKNVTKNAAEIAEHVLKKGNGGNYRAEMAHAIAFQLGLINTRKGGTTYSASFTLKNHRLHADDMFFFIGFHNKGKELTPAEKLMVHYYPHMIKNFIKYGKPDQDWKPSDNKGVGYFDLDFVVENDKITKHPQFYLNITNPDATKFWIYEEARNELIAKKAKIINHIVKDDDNKKKWHIW